MTTLRRFTQLAAMGLSLIALAGAVHAHCDPFAPVWATMTQEQAGDRPGCHVGPAPIYGRWFGDTEVDVLNYFTAGGGITLVSGGRQSTLAWELGLIDGQPPYMPRFAPFDGRFWVH